MDWNYLAGFFDGEGNLHINFIQNKKYLQLVCRIYSAEIIVLEKIKEFLGFGRIYGKKNGVKELVILRKNNVKFFLEGIFPYLILKKNVVEYVLKNYNFNHGFSENFSISYFRSFVKRKNVEKTYKNYFLNREPNNSI